MTSLPLRFPDPSHEAGGGVRSVRVLSTHDCPHGGPTLERVREVLGRLAPGAELAARQVTTLEESLRARMSGSPTVKVNGEDLEGEAAGPPALACRRYDGSGVPPVWLLEAALLRAMAPRHVLFLCVANSARSQMAEGIARSSAPADVRLSSAGSQPTQVSPEAVMALAEIGLDISGSRSKRVDEIEGSVDVVITLCAEEVCPVWLLPAHRVHWALPDPAAQGDGDLARMTAFRQVRDELGKRLAALFRE